MMMKNKHIAFLRMSIFIIGLISALMMFFPAISYQQVSYQGYEIVFGKELLNINPFNLGTIASAKLPFSMMAAFAYLLPFIGGSLLLYSSRFLFISIILFITSIFLLMLLPQFIEIIYTVGGSTQSLSVDWSMDSGLFATIIMTGIGSVLNLFLLYKTTI
jgi:hypothetical protein